MPMRQLKKRKEEFIKILQKNKIPKKVIDAFAAVNQEDFFDEIYEDRLYGLEPIPIGRGETSDEPLALARMIHYCGIKKDFHVLEIGTGSGYSTAVLAQLAKSVTTIEIDETLAVRAKERFKKLGLSHIRIFAGDGTEIDDSLGLYDGVIVLAGCRKRPLLLLHVAKPDSMIVFPMGPAHQQQIALLLNHRDDSVEGLYPVVFKEFCSFMPIIGMYG